MSLNGRGAYELNYRRHLPADKQAPLLDIGCGSGEFLAYLEQLGYHNLRGVDINPACVDASRRRTHAVIEHSPDLEAYLRGVRDTFALITLKSVIAHFPRNRAVAYLRAMRDALAPTGTLVVETFNASRWTGPYVLFNDLTHEWAYTEYTLKDILESAGFRVMELEGEQLPIRRLSTLLFHGTQWVWSNVLRSVYLVERGIGRNPRVLTKYLVAVCKKDA